ncbi:MAG TPA: hypothetical protein DDW52_23315 [Planctomycetaceae bacterium]|nr:hypothetical protein [Planctomycetaceae bacterium]
MINNRPTEVEKNSYRNSIGVFENFEDFHPYYQWFHWVRAVVATGQYLRNAHGNLAEADIDWDNTDEIVAMLEEKLVLDIAMCAGVGGYLVDYDLRAARTVDSIGMMLRDVYSAYTHLRDNDSDFDFWYVEDRVVAVMNFHATRIVELPWFDQEDFDEPKVYYDIHKELTRTALGRIWDAIAFERTDSVAKLAERLDKSGKEGNLKRNIRELNKKLAKKGLRIKYENNAPLRIIDCGRTSASDC